MPALAELLARRAGVALEVVHEAAELVERDILEHVPILNKRISIPCCNFTSPAGLVAAETADPWQKSGKYALAWVYFSIILLVVTFAVRWYHFWNDKIRTAVQKERTEEAIIAASPDMDFPPSTYSSLQSTRPLVVPGNSAAGQPEEEEPMPSTSRPMNAVFALFRWIFYHPIPRIRIRKGWRPIILPPLSTIALILAAFILALGYGLIPQPLYFSSIRFGSPPVAIRAGMIAVAMVPWIIALAMKANMISILTGLGHERLNILHRWLSYVFLVLSLIHTIPFYIVTDQDGYRRWKSYFGPQSIYIYGSGLAALVPLLFLCVQSLPPLRRKFYEVFVAIHVPVSILFLGTLFWHCHNYLTSWDYLFATVGIWVSSLIMRLFYLNWTNPWRMSWLIGDEAAITLLPENAVKITVPTQMKWRPGQYIYIRMPGISLFENHPFTIASLCSDDFPSEYGEGYHDLVVVYRPFGGFTKKVVDTALEHGPWHTYRAFLDGPYGGMRRSMDSFDHVVMFAGGSGITAVVSQLLDLIKRMRDGKAVTKTVHLIWAIKRPETIDWFKEELRICREFAPPDSVSCQFYVTAVKRQSAAGNLVSAHTPGRPVSMAFHEKVNDVFQNIASNRYSNFSTSTSQRNSEFIREVALEDPEKGDALREENADRLRPLPQAHVKTPHHVSPALRALERGYSSESNKSVDANLAPPRPTLHDKRRPSPLSLGSGVISIPPSDIQSPGHLSPPAHIRTPNVVSPALRALEAGLASPSAQDLSRSKEMPHMPPHPTLHERRRSNHLSLDISAARESNAEQMDQIAALPNAQQYDFGFPTTPTEFQKNLMRFAFMPAAIKPRKSKTGWGVEWGRPSIPYMLKVMSEEWTGRRACVFVCGPPSMRVDVSNAVAKLQTMVLKNQMDEVYLHAENYAL